MLFVLQSSLKDFGAAKITSLQGVFDHWIVPSLRWVDRHWLRDGLPLGSPPAPAKMKKLSILIADDSVQVCTLLSQWLRMHNTASVHSGTEALSALSLLHFDLIISDIVMPGVDGLTVIESLRATQPWVKIIAISGGGRFANAADCVSKAKELGADEALLKPFEQAQLNRAMVAVLGADVCEAIAAGSARPF
jgi:CheY-like chemotaxis protein